MLTSIADLLTVLCPMCARVRVRLTQVQGTLNANSKLSGMPDLVLSFVNARVIDDVR